MVTWVGKQVSVSQIGFPRSRHDSIDRSLVPGRCTDHWWRVVPTSLWSLV
jgi:hypothetical protein